MDLLGGSSLFQEREHLRANVEAGDLPAAPCQTSRDLARSTRELEDALLGAGLQKMLRATGAMQEGFMPFDAVSITAPVTGTLVHRPVERSLQWMERMQRPVEIVCVVEGLAQM